MAGRLIDRVPLSEAIEQLPRRERIVVCLYYGLGATLCDIAAVLELSRTRVWQLRERAVALLRRGAAPC